MLLKDISAINNTKTINILKTVESELINLLGNKVQDIILYGSYARNDYTNESDMDILVLVNDDKENIKLYEDKITDIMVDMSLEYDIVLSIYLQTVEEYKKKLKILPFLQNVEKEGIKIHEKGVYFKCK